MISSFNKFTKSIVWKVIFTLIMIPFMFLGIFQLIGNQGSSTANDIATIGESHVTLSQYQESYQQTYNTILQQMGEEEFNRIVTPAFEQRLRLTVLESLVERALAFEYANKLGIDPTYEQIVAQITNNPAFFDEQGKFSNTIYLQILEQNHIAPDAYAATIASDLKITYVQDLLKASLLTPLEIEDGIKNSFPIAEYKVATAKITMDPTLIFPEQQIKEYYDHNSHKFIDPAKYAISYIEFKPNAKVSEQEIADYFANHQVNYTNHTYTIYMLEQQDQPSAEAIYSKLTKDNFKQIASVESTDLSAKTSQGLLGNFQLKDLPIEFANQLADASQGTITTPFNYEGAWYILYVDAIKSNVLSLAQVSKEIQATILAEKIQALNDQFNNKVEEYRLTKKSIADLAKEFDLPLQQTSLFTANDAPSPFNRTDITDYLFSSNLTNGQIGDKLTLDNQVQIVFTPSDVVNQSVYPLEQVKAQVIKDLQFEAAKQKLEQQAAVFIADSLTGKASTEGPFKFSATQSYQLFIDSNHQVYLDKLFEQPIVDGKPALFTVNDQDNVYLVQVDKFKSGTLSKENQRLFSQQIKEIAEQSLLTAQFNKLRQEIKVTEYLDRIRQ